MVSESRFMFLSLNTYRDPNMGQILTNIVRVQRIWTIYSIYLDLYVIKSYKQKNHTLWRRIAHALVK